MEDSLPEKESLSDDIFEGIFTCTQCGKTFRRYVNKFHNSVIRTYSHLLRIFRNSYLKKHQSTHQLLENINQSNLFGQSILAPLQCHQTNNLFTDSSQSPLTLTGTVSGATGYNSGHSMSLKPGNTTTTSFQLAHFGGLVFNTIPAFDQSHFYTLSELYITQQLDRSSAFQYVPTGSQYQKAVPTVSAESSASVIPSSSSSSLMSASNIEGAFLNRLMFPMLGRELPAVSVK